MSNSMFLIYSPNGTNVHGARSGSMRAYGGSKELKVVKSCS